MDDGKEKSEYVKGVIRNHPNIIPKKSVLDAIFNEIRDKQSSKKNINVVEGITIELPVIMKNNTFTDKATVYSGSEATVFHISKLLALQKVLNHDFPIVIDSFRAEDLSTPKEKRVLELFCGLHNQSILTTTLKTEELGKYNDLENINHIDYDSHLPNHLLQPEHVEEMKELLSVLSLEL